MQSIEKIRVRGGHHHTSESRLLAKLGCESEAVSWEKHNFPYVSFSSERHNQSRQAYGPPRMRRHAIIEGLQVGFEGFRAQSLLSQPLNQKLLRVDAGSSGGKLYPMPHQIETFAQIWVVVSRFDVKRLGFGWPVC